MTTTYLGKYKDPTWVATNSIDDIAQVIPLHPDLNRNLYRTPVSRPRAPKKERIHPVPGKPQDPEHKVDDYA